MVNNGEIPPSPATPGTPGPPLFGGFHGNNNVENGRINRSKSFLKSCKCFGAEEWTIEDGSLPHVSCSLPPPPVSLFRKVGAEFFGTFILIFAGTATAIVNQKTQGSETLIGMAAAGGLAVMIIILSIGHISGAHINPSVTIAFAALKHFPWKHVNFCTSICTITNNLLQRDPLVPMYIAAQTLASICAAFALKALFHPVLGGGVTVPSGGYVQAFALEFTISFILMFVVTAVATDTRAVGDLAAIAVGATVTLNVLIAGPASGASMNPIRTLGPAIAANNYRAIWVYLIAPTLGTLCGAGIYSAVKLPEEADGDAHQRSSAAVAGARRSFRR